jgi:hypothetical protein
MSDIEHHVSRGGLDATLGYNEFAAPTSSGQAAQASCCDCLSKRAATHPPRVGGVGRMTLSRRSVAA